jgi:CubicO group peptidase (beta-lactamase class C family)
MLLKKLIIRAAASVAVVFGLLLAIAYFAVGYSPIYLYNAPSVATGIGAKLACSGRFVSGFDVEQTATDIEVYSAILSMLDYSYDVSEQSVSASFVGIKTRTARYLPGIGCALDYASIDERSNIIWPTLKSPQAAWPKGNVVFTKDPVVQQKLDSMLKADNDAGHDTRAMLIAHKGKIIAESYIDGIDENTPLLGWSMTKSVNSLILGHLEMKGFLNVSETELYPEWKGDERAEISIENLLHMTDGLAYDETYDPGEPAVRMLFQEPDAAQFMVSRKQRVAPGTNFNYSSGTANILADIVQERIEGDVQTDVDYIVENIFRPMGMTSVAYEMDASGLFIGSSYLYATARDWARIGQLMLNNGELNGTQIISPEFLAASLQNNTSANKPAYGYQWWLNTAIEPRWPDLPNNTYAAMGNREQRVLMIPDEELVIVRLGWSPKDYIDNENFNEIRSWVR